MPLMVYERSWLLFQKVVGGAELVVCVEGPKAVFFQHSFLWEPLKNWQSRHLFFGFWHCTSLPCCSASSTWMHLFGLCLPLVGPPPLLFCQSASLHLAYWTVLLQLHRRRVCKLQRPWQFFLFLSEFHWWWPFRHLFRIAQSGYMMTPYFQIAILPWWHQF